MENYELGKILGQGTYGVCHLATDLRDGQLYAVKRISLRNHKDTIAAQKEAEVLSRLKHPNVVEFKESFSDDESTLCIVVAYCEEGDLHTHIKRAATEGVPFPQVQIMDWLCELVSALSYIHGKRVLHRDLKTQNIFLARGKHVQLGDFGISKVLEATCDFATTFTGTPFYMAPEVCSNKPYTLKSDVWSLGCVLYEMCCLKHAFSGDNLVSLIMQIVSGTFPPIPDAFDFRLGNLIDMLLARDEGMRPTSKQIFELPLIQHHLRSMQEREVLQPGTVTGRRSRSALNGSAARGAAGVAAAAAAGHQPTPPQHRPPPIQPPPSPGSPGGFSFVSPAPAPAGPPPGQVLTPAQRLAAKRQAEIEARQQELSQAARENLQNKAVARDRHLQQFHSTAASPQAPAAAPHLGPDQARGRGQAPAGFGETVLYGGSTVTVPTLPELETLSVSAQSAGAAQVVPVNSPWAAPRGGWGGGPPPSPQQGAFAPRNLPLGASAAAEEVEEDIYEADFESDDEGGAVPAPEYLGARRRGPEECGLVTRDMDHRLEALRRRCRDALGERDFQAVYEYLSDVRRQPSPPGEPAIKSQLLQLVQRKDRLPLCFQVDQLVYQEIVFAVRKPG